MSQILSQVPRQLMQQRLTPQLIQAMDILQLGALALEARLAQEIDANPALELATDDEPTEAAEPNVDESAEGERALVVEDGAAAEDFGRLETLVREYDEMDEDAEFRHTRSRAQALEDGDTKLDAMNNTAARPISLHEYLEQQWGLADVDERARALGLALIDQLDDSGRLATPLEQIGTELHPPATPDELGRALQRVQQLDPPGVAARTVQECLLLQLAELPGENALERRIIAEHFDDLQRNRIPQIARALQVDVDEVKQAIAVIRQLSLHPGADFAGRQTPALVPDLVVESRADGDGYEVRLARADARELRIAPEFRALLERYRGDVRTREFAKQKLEAAAAIIDAVRFRRERLLEVGRAVVEAQRDFLDHGPQHLKVLRMSELAARFGCDPSTISRTVDEKYMQTPRGIFPLRQFFTGGAETDDGEALGWASIKAKVQEIVAQEDKAHPLSDDEIVDRLRTAGVEIKRRTVAKYRAQLDIPPARQRRQY